MTAGQFTTPHRQVQASMLVAALVVAYGVGLLTGLVVPRTVSQGAQIAGTVSAVQQPSALAVQLAGVPAAAPQGVDTKNFRGLQDFRAAEGIQHVGVPVTAPQGVDTQYFRGAQDFRAAEDSQRATRLGGP